MKLKEMQGRPELGGQTSEIELVDALKFSRNL